MVIISYVRWRVHTTLSFLWEVTESRVWCGEAQTKFMTNEPLRRQRWISWRRVKGFELFMEMRFRSCHLQRPHPVWAVHVEPKAQVTPTNAGRKRVPGRHLGDVTLPLYSWVRVEEFASAPLETPNKGEGVKYSYPVIEINWFSF